MIIRRFAAEGRSLNGDTVRKSRVRLFLSHTRHWLLADLDRGVETVRQTLRDGNIPKRSWILFYDSDLQSEWIGIWDDTPPPPMPEFEE